MACQHVIHRRGYLDDQAQLRQAYQFSRKVFAKIQAFRKTLRASAESLREDQPIYEYDDDDFPF